MTMIAQITIAMTKQSKRAMLMLESIAPITKCAFMDAVIMEYAVKMHVSRKIHSVHALLIMSARAIYAAHKVYA